MTPTSFLGGQYFNALRSLLQQEAPPLKMDFITERQGVFEDVLQETMLSVYKRAEKGKRPVTVHFLRPNGNEKPVSVQEVGRFALPANVEEPWFLPRHPDHVALLKRLASLPHRLSDYGFSVSTGPLVWNRHKDHLRLNMIRPSAGKPATFLNVIAAILNTKALDIAFRCISGSVAVSAFELNTLPMPSPEDMKAIEKLLRNGATQKMIEETVARIYGVENWFVSEPDKIVILRRGGEKKVRHLFELV